MKKGIGLPVFPGVAIGPAVVYRKAQRTLPVSSGDPAVEKAKFEAALETAREQLTALFEKAKVEIGEEQAAATIPSHLKAAIDYFIKYAGMDENGKQEGPMAGGVVIFAAGNDSRADDPVGKYDPVIAVGSIAPDYTRADYSNYGDWVDLAAPGGSVHYAQGEVLSTIPGNKYGTISWNILPDSAGVL